ncbi:hypothetical protein QQS21_010335 [Conoideocrella luteorostrata]|uniref:Alkylglycerone-phosphate synthase n=1 Tax=Conoideocrella luteorostrata TaxID=1105319 RepID=A0AAJ0CHJ1_9HYPO|nr:hypothetical protein QQS21_010335 [Conoideocrella luteorostrata]
MFLPEQEFSFGASHESRRIWGFTDTSYRLRADGQVEITGARYPSSGHVLPDLLPWITEVMRIQPPKKQSSPAPPPSAQIAKRHFNDAFIDQIQQILPPNHWSQDPEVCMRHGHGHSLEDMYKANYAGFTRIPDIVLYPDNASQVSQIIAAAHKHQARLLPYGGGTNVNGGLSCSVDETRLIAAVSLRRMNQVLWVDKANRLAKIEAGAVGRHIVAALAKHGMTLGHEPDSIEFSTLGGWIATKASGMKKNRYGNIEDILLQVEMATPCGVIGRFLQSIPPRESVGVDSASLALGSEGNLGIITSAIVKISPLPEHQIFGSLLFKTFANGMAFLYDLARNREQPASVRLIDNAQFQFGMALKPRPAGFQSWKRKLTKAYVTKIRKFDPQMMTACTLVFEGSMKQIAKEQSAVYYLARKHGGLYAGAANGKQGYELTFAIAYIRDFAMTIDIFAESFETSCTWTAAPELYQRVIDRVRREHLARSLPGIPFLSARISQIYDTGVTIYFYLAISVEGVTRPLEAYKALERAARDEILSCGGALSHHHGVGTLRSNFLPRIFSTGSMECQNRLRSALDCRGVFSTQ